MYTACGGCGGWRCTAAFNWETVQTKMNGIAWAAPRPLKIPDMPDMTETNRNKQKHQHDRYRGDCQWNHCQTCETAWWETIISKATSFSRLSTSSSVSVDGRPLKYHSVVAARSRLLVGVASQIFSHDKQCIFQGTTCIQYAYFVCLHSIPTYMFLLLRFPLSVPCQHPSDLESWRNFEMPVASAAFPFCQRPDKLRVAMGWLSWGWLGCDGTTCKLSMAEEKETRPLKISKRHLAQYFSTMSVCGNFVVGHRYPGFSVAQMTLQNGANFFAPLHIQVPNRFKHLTWKGNKLYNTILALFNVLKVSPWLLR